VQVSKSGSGLCLVTIIRVRHSAAITSQVHSDEQGKSEVELGCQSVGWVWIDGVHGQAWAQLWLSWRQAHLHNSLGKD